MLKLRILIAAIGISSTGSLALAQRVPPPPPTAQVPGARQPTPTAKPPAGAPLAPTRPSVAPTRPSVALPGGPQAIPVPPVPVAVLPAPWSMAQGGADRFSSYPGKINAARLALSWQYTAPARREVSNGPIVVDGVVYVAVESTLRALDATTGEKLAGWTKPFTPAPLPGQTASPLLTTTPAYAGGYLYVGSGDGVIHVIDATNGAAVDESVRVGAAIRSSPEVQGDLLYFGAENGTVYAYHIPSGGGAVLQPAWSRTVSPGDGIRGPVAIDGNLLYAATGSGQVFELDRLTGKELFGSGPLGQAIEASPVATPTAVYVAAGTKLLSLTPTGLRTNAEQTFPEQISAPPAYTNGVLFVATRDGNLYAYKPVGAGGRVLWSAALGAASYVSVSPVIVGDTLIVATNNGHVFAFATNGDGAGRYRLIWRYLAAPPPAYENVNPNVVPGIVAQPAVYGNALFILNRDGTIDGMSTTAVDYDGPVVDRVFPSGGPYNPQPVPPVMARIRDSGSGLAPSTVQLIIDGATTRGFKFDINTGVLTYTPPTAFTNGVHNIEITAEDNRGNQTNHTWSFTIDPNARLNQQGGPNPFQPGGNRTPYTPGGGRGGP